MNTLLKIMIAIIKDCPSQKARMREVLFLIKQLKLSSAEEVETIRKCEEYYFKKIQRDT